VSCQEEGTNMDVVALKRATSNLAILDRPMFSSSSGYSSWSA
jgi:hypothetical protein